MYNELMVKETLEIYKYKEYLRFGFTDYQARQLSEINAISAADIREVINKGCGVNIAYRIFRP